MVKGMEQQNLTGEMDETVVGEKKSEREMALV